MQNRPTQETRSKTEFAHECYRVLLNLLGQRPYKKTLQPELRHGKQDSWMYDADHDLKIRITFGWPVPSCVTVTAFAEAGEFSGFVSLPEAIASTNIAELSRQCIVPVMTKLADWLVV